MCSKCGATPSKLIRTTIVLATRLSHSCECGRSATIKPEVIENTETNGNSLRSVKLYAINIQLMLLTHLIGGSYKAALSICALLNLCGVNFKQAWSGMEDVVYVKVAALTKDIVDKNVLEELEGVDVDPEDNRRLGGIVDAF